MATPAAEGCSSSQFSTSASSSASSCHSISSWSSTCSCMELEITLKITSTNVGVREDAIVASAENMSNAPALVGELRQERDLRAIHPIAASSTLALGY